MTHPQPPDAVEPLSCPFCGGAAEWNKGKRGDGSDWRYIACSECEATAPYSNDDGQIEAWNKRPADPLRLALGEAAVRAILAGEAAVVKLKDEQGFELRYLQYEDPNEESYNWPDYNLDEMRLDQPAKGDAHG